MTFAQDRRTFLKGVAAAGAAALPLAFAAPGRTVEAEHLVAIEHSRFTPAKLRVRPGDRVRWINKDIVPHTATAEDGSWDTGHLARGESAVIVFAAAGELPYYCGYHPSMRAVLDVA